jgi:hypothetical protein
VQFLKANKYNPAIKGHSKLLVENIIPCNKIILKERFINKISDVIILTVKNRKLGELCEADV